MRLNKKRGNLVLWQQSGTAWPRQRHKAGEPHYITISAWEWRYQILYWRTCLMKVVYQPHCIDIPVWWRRCHNNTVLTYLYDKGGVTTTLYWRTCMIRVVSQEHCTDVPVWYGRCHKNTVQTYLFDKGSVTTTLYRHTCMVRAVSHGSGLPTTLYWCTCIRAVSQQHCIDVPVW